MYGSYFDYKTKEIKIIKKNIRAYVYLKIEKEKLPKTNYSK